MKIAQKLPVLVVGLFILGGLGVALSKLNGPSTRATVVNVTVPSLSPKAKRGQQAFAENCASCHGENASGTEQGPPLVHNIYNPGHHADASFFLAVKRGVRSHHWPYGDMPPQPHVNVRNVSDILTYVRELQTANAITYRPHQM